MKRWKNSGIALDLLIICSVIGLENSQILLTNQKQN